MEMLFIEYDNILIGKQDDFSAYHFAGSKASQANEKRALACIKYAIEYVLGWTPEEASKKFDRYMIEQMKLTKLLKYIEWPIEIPKGDPDYIISLLYPEVKRLDPESMVLRIYKDVLDNHKQFPRDYFSGEDAYSRFAICLKYLVDHYHPFENIGEIYQFFHSVNGRKLLNEYRLLAPIEKYGINLDEAIRTITEDYYETDLYYEFWKFKTSFEKLPN